MSYFVNFPVTSFTETFNNLQSRLIDGPGVVRHGDSRVAVQHLISQAIAGDTQQKSGFGFVRWEERRIIGIRTGDGRVLVVEFYEQLIHVAHEIGHFGTLRGIRVPARLHDTVNFLRTVLRLLQTKSTSEIRNNIFNYSEKFLLNTKII